MFFQNPCGSQRRRDILETNARAKKTDIVSLRNWDEPETRREQRAWSRMTREGWGQNFIVTLQEKKFYTKKTIWKTESVKINNYEIFIIFLRTKRKEWYLIAKGSWFLQNFLLKTTFYRHGWYIWLVRGLRCARSWIWSPVTSHPCFNFSPFCVALTSFKYP